MKILTVLGARPQFVKAAVISRAISSFNGEGGRRIDEVIVHTGQHYDVNMSDIFFREMLIPDPDYNLGVSNTSHGSMTGRMLEKIEKIIIQEDPDIVLVYGDTNSTLAGALAAAKMHIPVAHVEAGLRSFNMLMPEEINRILTDRVSQFLFCPTMTAVKNLSEEGMISNSRIMPKSSVILNVGDVMYDAVLFYRRTSRPSSATMKLIDRLKSSYYLTTVHRAENTDDYDRLKEITEAFNVISRTVPVIFPMHPRTRKIMEQHGLSLNGAEVIDPVGYFDMLYLIENSLAVFTDSGGLQKEAFFFQKPCITLRDETEWVELVENRFNILTGASRANILSAESNIADRNHDYSVRLYGMGDAGEKIVKVLSDYSP